MDVGTLKDLGYPLAVYPMSPMFAAVHGMRKKLLELKETGSTVNENGQVITRIFFIINFCFRNA